MGFCKVSKINRHYARARTYYFTKYFRRCRALLKHSKFRAQKPTDLEVSEALFEKVRCSFYKKHVTERL